ncbi:MAG: PEP-CTERM sorting domain-containing protein [Betaproteobacteria bacterium]|nr:PEP-CTERM sorting domain-containing protein [Betaproteobacteria bacterium]
MRLNIMKSICAVALLGVASAGANADVIRVTEENFLAGSGMITFSEFSLGTTNPVYSPADYGGELGDPTVSFGGYFLGQSLSTTPSIDCPGAAATACIVGTPIGPLSLDPNSPVTFITTDASNPSSPVLSGRPTYNGPIAILFDIDVAAVGFDAGYFDAIGSTGITAFARDGTILGTVVNTGLGIEFLGLVTSDQSEMIAGVFLDLISDEPAGFAVDNLRFGYRETVTVPIPEPETYAMLLAGLAVVGVVTRRRRSIKATM